MLAFFLGAQITEIPADMSHAKKKILIMWENELTNIEGCS